MTLIIILNMHSYSSQGHVLTESTQVQLLTKTKCYIVTLLLHYMSNTDASVSIVLSHSNADLQVATVLTKTCAPLIPPF